jgi:UDP-N-acetylglucosamine 2-epimerase (non-hydrolysing)
MNRVFAGRLARWHFAPTTGARDNLLREGTPAQDVYVTGNTVIDALHTVIARAPDAPAQAGGRRLILVTAHRRESFGQPLVDICNAIRTIALRNADVDVLYPVHPNPNVRRTVDDLLGKHPRIRLVEPLDYLPFVAAMRGCYLILTDSGGVQEEAPAIGKPVLVLREETERPEAVAAGVVKLVGSDTQRIVQSVQQLLDDPAAYREMAQGVSPYGDGKAAGRIARVLQLYRASCN